MNLKELQDIQKKAATQPPQIQKTVEVDTPFGVATADVPAAVELALTVEPAKLSEEEKVASAQRLEIVVQESGLVGESAHELVAKFAPLMAEAKGFADTAKSVTVTDESQMQAMKLARATRLALRAVRIRAENLRKGLKAESIQRGKAIDGVYNLIEYLVSPIETRLEECENFAQTAAAQRAEKLRADREELLRPYSIDTSFYELAAMPEETFARLLEDTRRSHESKVAEKIRIEKEKQENDRLEKLKTARESTLALYGLTPLAAYGIATTNFEFKDNRIELLSGQDFETLRAAARGYFDAKQARLKKEKEAEDARLAQLEADAEKGRQAQKRIDDQKKADAKLRRAPDGKKLRNWAAAIMDIPTPAMATEEGKFLAAEMREKVDELCKTLVEEACKL
jgi:hypothetical protein